MSGGALATFEATRFATGRKNSIRLEINGSRGSIAFDFEDMNVLHVHDATADAAATPASPGCSSPRPRTPTSPDGGPPVTSSATSTRFTHQAVDFLTAIAEGTDPRPSFSDGFQVQRILSAVETSAEREGSWTPIDGARVPSPSLS